MIDVNVEDVGPCRKLLKIRVPQEDLRRKLDESYEELRQNVDVDGFRKGHAPRKLLEKRFGDQVIEDLKQTVMSEASKEALEQTEIKFVGEPGFDSADFKIDEDFSFDMTVETEPEFELPDYQGLKLEKPSEEPTEEDIDETVKGLLKQVAEAEEVTEGGAEKGDIILCDWEVKVGEETAMGSKDERFELNDHSLAQLGITDAAARVSGANKGDVVEMQATVPEDYPVERFRGQEGAMSITVKGVSRPNIPELTDESAKEIGYDTAEELREEVKRYISDRKKQNARVELEKQVEDALLEKIQFDVPEGAVKNLSMRNLNRYQTRLRMRGLSDDDIASHMDELRNASEESADREFRLYFVLRRIADAEKIYVTEDEVENAIQALAARRGQSPVKLRQEMEQDDSIDDMRATMRMNKTLDLLIEKAEITEPS